MPTADECSECGGSMTKTHTIYVCGNLIPDTGLEKFDRSDEYTVLRSAEAFREFFRDMGAEESHIRSYIDSLRVEYPKPYPVIVEHLED